MTYVKEPYKIVKEDGTWKIYCHGAMISSDRDKYKCVSNPSFQAGLRRFYHIPDTITGLLCPFKHKNLASSDGFIYSLKSNRILKPYIGEDGKPTIHLTYKGKQDTFMVAGAVLSCFTENTIKSYEIRYKDGNRTNCSLNNIYYHIKNLKDVA